MALPELYPQAEFVGVARNPAAIATARTQPSLQNATFVVGDIQEGLPAGPFDLVYTAVVLYHVPDLARAVALVHDVLAPGGVFWIREPHPRLPERATQPDHQYIAEQFCPRRAEAGRPSRRRRRGAAPADRLGGMTTEGEALLANWIAGTRGAAQMLSQLTGSPAEEIVGHTTQSGQCGCPRMRPG